jgi:hypothetical protein
VLTATRCKRASLPPLVLACLQISAPPLRAIKFSHQVAHDSAKERRVSHEHINVMSVGVSAYMPSSLRSHVDGILYRTLWLSTYNKLHFCAHGHQQLWLWISSVFDSVSNKKLVFSIIKSSLIEESRLPRILFRNKRRNVIFHRPYDGRSTHLWNVVYVNETTRRYIPKNRQFQKKEHLLHTILQGKD